MIALVNIAALRTDDRDAIHKAAYEIGESAHEYGFLRICGHGIAPELINGAYAASKQFFAMPESYKRRYYIGFSSNHRGYVPFSEKGDYPDETSRNYEAFDLGLDLPSDDPDYLAGNRLLGPNVWPDLYGFQSVISQYYTEIAQLGQLICYCLEIYLNLPKGAIRTHMQKPISQLRLLHYVRPSDLSDHKSVNMGAHTDYECLTLLHTGNPGLQVMTKDDSWIDVPVDPDVFVVNIGDMLEAWSNGILKSTPHRVANLSPERFSMPYFVAADYHTVIKPFKQLNNLDRPTHYAPFVAGEHLENMLLRDFPYLREEKKSPPPINGYTNPFENRLNPQQV